MQGTAERQFLAPEGCGVYQDRPAACRYYALGATTKRATGSARPEEFYFAVKEAHCLGHDELRTLAVREYRQEQGVASCDLDNFRVFVFSPFFHDVYDTEPAYFQKLLSDEVELMQFAAHYLKQVLFGENTIPEKPDAIEKRKKRREEIIAKQREQMRKEMERDIDLPSE